MTYEQLLRQRKSLQKEIENIRSDTIELMCNGSEHDFFILAIQRTDLLRHLEKTLQKINLEIVNLELTVLLEKQVIYK